MLYFFQQEGVAEAAQEAEPVVEEKTLSLFDLMMSGGLGG
jgi:biopolymer transport protein ExbB